jgi:hypothetical protein
MTTQFTPEMMLAAQSAAAADIVEFDKAVLARGGNPFTDPRRPRLRTQVVDIPQQIVRSITAQAPPVGGEAKFEITVKTLATTAEPPPGTAPAPLRDPNAPRWTQPSQPREPPPPPPSSFAQNVTAAISSRLGKRANPKVATEPDDPEPASFAERLVRAIKRRRRGYAPKFWQQPTN